MHSSNQLHVYSIRRNSLKHHIVSKLPDRQANVELLIYFKGTITFIIVTLIEGTKFKINYIKVKV